MKNKYIFSLVFVSSLLISGCNKGGKKEKEPDYTPITVMSVNLDQGHQNNTIFHAKVKEAITSVMPDLFGVQEEGDGWVEFLKDTFEDYGYKHIYQTRGGSFSEASGIFINLDRFEIKESGTFWYGPDGGENKSSYIATEWGASLPRVCSWALLHDKYADKDISYFNTHFEHIHAFGDMNKSATPEDNNVICRENSAKQVIEKMKSLNVPGFFTGDLNSFRENEPSVYQILTEYFDDAWAKAPVKDEMCSYHNYGRELNPDTRVYPYSPIDYIFSTKDQFTARNFTIMHNEGTTEEDFASDHFFVHATFGYGLNNYGEKEDKPKPTSSSKPADSSKNPAESSSISNSSSETPAPSSQEPVSYDIPEPNENAIKVMSANLDQGHQDDSYFHNRILSQFETVGADLIGVQEEGNGWINALTNAMKTKGYTHITQSRGGSWPEASGIFIKDDRFTVKESGTMWFGPNGGENKSGYIATEWGASFPRVCTWALLTDKKTGKDICYCNAHLEYDHAFGNMNGDATSESNTKYCRQMSCKQVIDKMKSLNVPGFFTGDLNSFRSLEPTVYNQCLSYFDDSWADYPLSQKMCTFHNYGKELNPSTRQYPYEPIDYIYSTKDQFDVTNFTIMNNEGTSERDFDSDHFFVHATFNYAA